MVIGLDIRSISHTPTGVGRYVTNLLSQFARVGAEHRYLLFSDTADVPKLEAPLGNCQRVQLRAAEHALVWQYCSLLPALLRASVDVVHFPSYTMPVIKPRRSVVTIHDISYSVHPEWYPLKGAIALAWASRYAARHADLVLTCSEHTKQDIVEQYGVPKERIRVIYHGIEPRFAPVDDPAEKARVRAQYGLTAAKVVLYVGSIHTRRNIDKLIEAFHRVRQQVADVQLLLVGKYEYMGVDLGRLIRELDLCGAAIMADYVRDEDLPALYSVADVFVFPSSYEGFGFPPMEAMACGTAVVTSNNTSLREVAGGGAVLTDPLKVEGMADCIATLLMDDGWRREIAGRGLAHVRRYRWEHAARETLAAYRDVAS